MTEDIFVICTIESIPPGAIGFTATATRVPDGTSPKEALRTVRMVARDNLPFGVRMKFARLRRGARAVAAWSEETNNYTLIDPPKMPEVDLRYRETKW